MGALFPSSYIGIAPAFFLQEFHNLLFFHIIDVSEFFMIGQIFYSQKQQISILY